MAPGSIYVDDTGSSATRYYWVRFVNTENVKGPYNATSGATATTGPEVTYLLSTLTGSITESQLFTDLGSRINLIDGASTLAGSVNARVAAEAEARGAAITTEAEIRDDADSALAGQITTLSSTVGSNTAAITAEVTTRASETGSLFAKYTVKIDTNGYVSGFGLASTANNATPFSEFAIRADRFYIASPSGPGITPIIPFIANTTEQTVNGVTVPIGVYMDAAFIKNGTITNAKIGNLAVDDAKIANLSVGKLTAGSIAADQYIQSSNYVADTSGFRLDANGNAYLQNAVVRGTVYATAGTFAGSLSAATGDFAGSLTAATGSFAGSLTAATGTFSGTLTASAINAVNTINIAGNAVTVPTVVTFPAGRAGVSFLGGAANVLQDLGTFYPSQVPTTTSILVSAYLNDAYMQFNYDATLGISFLRAKILRFHYDGTTGALISTYTVDSRGEATITSNGETVAVIDFGPGKHIVPNEATLDHHTRVFSVVDSVTKPAGGPWKYYLNICRPTTAPAVYCYIAYASANSFCLAIKR
jgi:hypothetical protein